MNLIAAAIIGIAVIVLLIAACKVHPFLSLLAGSFVMAVCAGVPFDKAFDSFTSGVGGTISNVGLLIAFGSINRHHPVQVGRCGHHRRHHHGQDTVAASAVGHGTDTRSSWASRCSSRSAWSSSSRWCCSPPVVPSPLWCCSASRPSPACPRCTPSCRRTPVR